VQRRELEYASRKLSAIEINGTYYGAQKPESFARWSAETPDDFVFSVKAPRYATNRRVLAEAGETIERFVTGGVMELKEKLGPINWQFMATKKFDPDDFEAFLKLLPKTVDGRHIRHAVEVRHDSFKVPEFVELAREHGIAIVVADKEDAPLIADITAPFVYLRLQRTSEAAKTGYAPKELDAWVKRAQAWEKGSAPADLKPVAAASKAKATPRDVFVYMIGGHKVSNPAAAMAFMERLG
jgi:uncharacterized protein YecE (DUF72 family)